MKTAVRRRTAGKRKKKNYRERAAFSKETVRSRTAALILKAGSTEGGCTEISTPEERDSTEGILPACGWQSGWKKKLVAKQIRLSGKGSRQKRDGKITEKIKKQ